MKVVLTGVLGAKFGTDYEFATNSPKDCISALLNMLDGFEEFVKLNNFNTWLNDRNVGINDLAYTQSKETVLHIGLHVDGAGQNAGWLMVVAGIALIAFTWWNPMSWGASASMIAYGMGAGIAISGLGMAMMPVATPSDASDNKASYAFNDAATTTEQGNPVPVLYGRGLIGGFMIMYRISTKDI